MDEQIEGKLFVTFDKFEDFLRDQEILLATSIAEEPNPSEDAAESMLCKKLFETVRTDLMCG